MEHVLLLKEGGAECRFASALRAAGHEAWHCAVLGDAREAGGSARCAALLRAGLVWGVAVTSARAAHELAHAAREPGASLAGLEWFAVGSATAEAAATALALPPQSVSGGRVAGSAALLAPIVVEAARRRGPETAGKRLLFPCSNIRRDELPDALRAAGLDFDEVCVYCTIELPDPALPDVFLAPPAPPPAAQEQPPPPQHQQQQQNRQRWCVLFSPSGVRSLLASARRPALDVKLLAIGETTLAALRACELGQRYDTRVCASPTPQGVLDAIAAG
jgi:uroporphyrinogen-III synthase